MISRSVARRYAVALFQAAEGQGVVDEVESHLADLVRYVDQDRGLAQLLSNRRIPRGQRQEAVLNVLGEGAPTILQNFLRLVIDKQREHLLSEFHEEYYETMLAAKGIVEAEVITAVDLSEPGLERIRQRLEEITGKQVRVVPRTNPELVGGLVVRIGDRRLDGSLRRRLKEMGQAMVGGTGRDQEGVAVP